MSLQLAEDVVTKFESEVHHAYQPIVKGIREKVRVKSAAGAKTVQFPTIGKGITEERTNYHTDIPVMNVSHGPVTVVMKDWTASELTDIFMNNKVNYDEQQELVKSITMALERRCLQLIIDALVAATITKTVAKNISGSNDNLNMAMLAQTSKLLGKDGVDKDGRTLLCHTYGIHHFTQESTVASGDYNSLQVLTKGDIGAYYGYNFYEVADMDEGGLPLATSDRTNFAFHKNAVGLGVNMEPKVTIDWEPSKGAHRVTGWLSANACVIDTDGVVEITTYEA